MTPNNNYEILTSKGFKDFKGLKQSKHKEYVSIEYNNNETFLCSKDHKILIDNKITNVLDIKVGTIISDKTVTKVEIIKDNKENIFYDPVAVKDTGTYLINGVTQKNCDEAAFIRNSDYEEFMDSVMPAMAAIQNSQAIFSSTANGLNFFYSMVEGARKKVEVTLNEDDLIELEDGSTISAEKYLKMKKVEEDEDN